MSRISKQQGSSCPTIITITAITTDTSLHFLNKNPKQRDYYERQEEDVLPRQDKFPLDKKKKTVPTIDQDAKWMEMEGVTELGSIFLVFLLLAAAQALW